jgi:hypothetical protein
MSKWAIAALTAAGALVLAGVGVLVFRKPSSKLAPAVAPRPAAPTSAPSLELALVQEGGRLANTLGPLVLGGDE